MFLEINPAGQFPYLEGSSGLLIAAALAARLATEYLIRLTKVGESMRELGARHAPRRVIADLR
jgi:hypothetical protein